MKLAGLNTELRFTENFGQVPPGTLDFRETIHPKRPLPADFPEPLRYPQIFEDRHGFIGELSMVDFLFCMGKWANR